MDKRPELAKSRIVEKIPEACCDETAAVEFFEKQRWPHTPCCVHCGSIAVYKMVEAKTGQRNKRYLWRCRDCKKQYTVRIGTVYEDSRIELRHWCYAFWRASTSKKGVSALEIKRQCQISYKSALFLMTRIRFAMAPDNPEMLQGTVECDETYVGGKPRYRRTRERGWSRANKTPVFVAVERNGRIRRRVMAEVNSMTLKAAIREVVSKQARLVTDELPAYRFVGSEMEGGHHTVTHSTREYVRGDIHTNTPESSFALLKRGIIGIHHSVSNEYLHRYLWHFDFLWNLRKLNDGERTIAAIRAAEGKRLMYEGSIQ
jgi:transposase-like protein